jgi:hypothetical protein
MWRTERKLEREERADGDRNEIMKGEGEERERGGGEDTHTHTHTYTDRERERGRERERERRQRGRDVVIKSMLIGFQFGMAEMVKQNKNDNVKKVSNP